MWRANLIALVERLRAQGARIAAWGAGSRGTALLNGIHESARTFTYVVDSDPLKHRRFLSGVGLPAHAPGQLRTNPVDFVLVTSYTYLDEIASDLKCFRRSGGRIVRPYSEPLVLPKTPPP